MREATQHCARGWFKGIRKLCDRKGGKIDLCLSKRLALALHKHNLKVDCVRNVQLVEERGRIDSDAACDGELYVEA
jgi:hypothetical protein